MDNMRIDKRLAILLAVIFVAALIPCIVIAFYSHPAIDDYSFGTLPRQARVAGGSAFDIVGAAIKQVANSYETWQGTFSGIFLMALQPAVFGEGLYFIGLLVVYAILIAATIYFTRAATGKRLNKYEFINVVVIILALNIHFLHSPVEAFYWYNSAMYYTGFYSMSLFLYGYSLNTIINNKSNICRVIVIIMTSAFIGGGNYVTALLSIELLLCLCIYLFKTKSRYKFTMLSAVIAMTATLSVSAMAPGNAVRAEFFDSWPFFQAILQSFKNGIIYLFKYSTNLPVILCIAFLLPYLIRFAGKLNFSFKYPAAVLALAFCIYCSQYAPTLYGTGGMGGGRVQNIRFFAYIWYMLFNITYIAGWLNRRPVAEPKALGWQKHSLKWSIAALVLAVLSLPTTNYTNITGISAARSLITGQARIYHQEQLSRESLLLSDQPRVILSRLTYKPYVLFFVDVSIDEDGNNGIRTFYGKESVLLDKGE